MDGEEDSGYGIQERMLGRSVLQELQVNNQRIFYGDFTDLV